MDKKKSDEVIKAAVANLQGDMERLHRALGDECKDRDEVLCYVKQLGYNLGCQIFEPIENVSWIGNGHHAAQRLGAFLCSEMDSGLMSKYVTDKS